MSQSPESFYDLSPHDVLNAIEQAGYPLTGRYLQLNSYENRVFDVELEEVENVEINLKKGYAKITVKKGETLPMDEVKEIIKDAGYLTND